jgi:hypothetical protein
MSTEHTLGLREVADGVFSYLQPHRDRFLYRHGALPNATWERKETAGVEYPNVRTLIEFVGSTRSA